MIASLLPGVRELRVPLVVGTLWLAALFAGLSGIGVWSNIDSLFENVRAVAGFFGPLSVAAALALAAYLIGVCLHPASKWFTRTVFGAIGLGMPSRAGLVVDPREFVGDASEDVGARQASFDRLTNYRLVEELSQFMQRVIIRARRRGVQGRQVLEYFPRFEPSDEDVSLAWDEARAEQPEASDESISAFVESSLVSGPRMRWASVVVGELHLAEVSLRASSRDTFDKYDRLQAEAEFRDGVALPLLVLALTVAGRLAVDFGSGWWILLAIPGLVSVVPLVRGAASIGGEARDLMLQAILAEHVKTPTISLIEGLEQPTGPQAER